LAEAISIPVIASGGFASIEDRQGAAAAAAQRSWPGAIAGRALYDGPARSGGRRSALIRNARRRRGLGVLVCSRFA